MQHREYVRTDGRQQSVGPVHFQSKGVLIVNRTRTDAAFFDDAGNEYDAPARVAVTYPLNIPTSRMLGGTVLAIAGTDNGTLSVTVTDAETILSTAQLATIALGTQSVIQYVNVFPATAQPDGTIIAWAVDEVNFPGVVWMLRFNATTAAWEKIGGSPLRRTSAVADAGAIAAWAKDLRTTITLPRTGDYTVRYYPTGSTPGAVGTMFTVADNHALGAPTFNQAAETIDAGPTSYGSPVWTGTLSGFAAGVVIGGWWFSGGAQVNMNLRTLEIDPIRLS